MAESAIITVLADECRHPEHTENAGFRVVLRLHGMTRMLIVAQSRMPDSEGIT
jgi:hypothetical protein